VKPNLKLPKNLDAERAVLGAIILDNSVLPCVRQVLETQDFMLPEHRLIFDCIHTMCVSDSPVDLLTLTEELNRRGELGKLVDAAYVSKLIDGLPQVSNARFYAQIVRDLGRCRRIAHGAEKIRNAALSPEARASNLIVMAIETFSKLEGETAPAEGVRIRQWEEIPTVDQLPNISTSWVVDQLIADSSITLLAGEPSSYKTWLASLIARGVATGRTVLGRQCHRRDVLILDRENPVPVVRERASIVGLPSSSSLKYWGGWESDSPPMIGDPRLLEIARKRKLLIIYDSLVRFHRGDENAAAEMAPTMAHLRDLANVGAAIIVIHHRAKAESSKFRGSSDILAAVDFAFSISRENDNGHLRMQCFKNRVGNEFELILQPDLAQSGDILVIESDGRRKLGEYFKKLSNIIENAPGINQSELIKKSGIAQKLCVSILKKGEGTNWRTERGERNTAKYFPIGPFVIVEN
jgi:hypothetical protein